jgi:GWxTD domain-containing protein
MCDALAVPVRARCSGIISTGVWLLIAAGPLAAQGARYTALRDTLAGVTNAASLRSRLAEDARDANANVARGFIAFRIFELTGSDADLKAARAAFDRTLGQDGRNAWAQFGVALTMANEPDVRSIDLVQTGRGLAKELGLDTRSKALGAARKALQLDAGLASAAVLVGHLALLSRDEGELETAASLLEPFTRGDPPIEAADVMYSQVQVARGEAGHAVDVATVAANRPDASLAAKLAYATALFNDRGGEEDGGDAYFEVVDGLAPALADRLFEDVRWIATAGEIAAWDSASLDARKDWLHEFWERRAALSGETVAERVAEHYRRLNVVLSRYVKISNGPLPGQTLIPTQHPEPFDERGIIYLRHGEPDHSILTPVIPPDLSLSSTACQTGAFRPDTAKWGTSSSGPLRNTESWVYDDLDGHPRMYNFVQCAGIYPDYVIPYELPCDASTYQLYVEPRSIYESEIGRCANDTRERIRDYAREALVTDSDHPSFERTVPLLFDLVAFRGPGGFTELTAPLAISTDSLGPRTRRNSIFRLGITVAVVDTAERNISRSDTTIVAAPASAATQGDWLNTFVRFIARPSNGAELRISVRDRTADGGNFFGTTITVPSYAGDSLQVSSIVLGLPAEGGDWRRGSVALTLMPFGEYRTGEFRAFYEIYNMADSASYDTELRVEPMRDGALDPARPPSNIEPIVLRFSDEARPERDGVVRDLRNIRSQLPPGRYRITVTVTDRAGGRSASSWRPFVIPPPPR